MLNKKYKLSNPTIGSLGYLKFIYKIYHITDR